MGPTPAQLLETTTCNDMSHTAENHRS
jgi:hypothetical protein